MTTGTSLAGFENFIEEGNLQNVDLEEQIFEKEEIPLWIIIALIIGVLGLIVVVAAVFLSISRRLEKEAADELEREIQLA